MSNVSVHRRRTLCAVRVESIVRIFILAARMFHSQFQIVFSSAESGRISGQADLHIFYPNVSVHRTAHFVRRTVERLVRLHFHFVIGPFRFAKTMRPVIREITNAKAPLAGIEIGQNGSRYPTCR